MDLLTLLGIAIALAMDAFAVALATSLSLPRLTGRHLFRFGFHFGLFQALMPIIGWATGLSIREYIEAFDHWLAFLLLGLVGGKMLWEAFHPDSVEQSDKDPTRGLSLVMLSIATSIDALAIGLSLAMLEVDIWYPSVIIGIITAGISLGAIGIGKRLGVLFGKRMEIFGGLILIFIGSRIVFLEFFG